LRKESILIENMGFTYKNGSRNFLAELRRVTVYGGKIRARMRM